MKISNIRQLGVISLFVLAIMLTSCTKFVELDAPPTLLSEANVYANDETATSVLTGIYTQMSTTSSNFTGIRGLSLLGGLSADEFKLSSNVTDLALITYFQNALSVRTSPGSGFESWTPLYKLIFYCNSAIEGLQKSTTLTPSVKQQLLGEGKFTRALCYFYLVNNFGDVPLALSTDYKENTSMSRTPAIDVYNQIVKDLEEAKGELSSNYLNGKLQTYASGVERLRPTKWAAAALLARVYLYLNQYDKAEAQSTFVINNSALFSLIPLNNVFLKTSQEAIWQIQPTETGRNTEEARVFVLNSQPSNNKPVSLSQDLLNSFETNDARKSNWIKDTTLSGIQYFYSFKYKIASLNQPVTEYFTILRLGEQYLIRAESRAQLNNISGAQSDLNQIRSRAGLTNTPANDKTSLLAAIIAERRIELFSEMGHRWYDLKRINAVDAVMGIAAPIKGGTWEPYDKLYPLPLLELEKNPNLTQNSGY
jgi:starch-binding outer membrane protein, SusD/RagB family